MFPRAIPGALVEVARRGVPGGAPGKVGLAAATACLPGCMSAGAPAIPLFGAYFPSWLACAGAGVLGAILMRVVFIRVGIDDALSLRLPVYVCLAAAIGFLVSLLGFGR
ncbi:MAG: YtcA family lipoprotein [Roseateles sp.]|uniref:YtcA family lipoprotein n=1 Tax=Roseateles sp. TaxID=1971397 RepID=UPI0039E9D2F1